MTSICDRSTPSSLADAPAGARELVEQFDQPIERRTELYRPGYIAASRLRTLIERLLSAGTQGEMASSILF